MARARAGLKTRRTIAGTGAVIAAAAVATAVIAQSSGGTFDLSFRATSGGGGKSAAAPYEVTGSIGQPITGHSVGGEYVVDSGFLGGGGIEKFRRFIIAIARDP